MDRNFFIKGVSLGFLARNGYYRSEVGKAEVERICDMGSGWVALMATIMQDSYSSTRTYADFNFTPSDLELADTIRRFHERGVKVMLKPIVENHDSVWRGMINFPEGHQQIQGIVTDYWGEWFKNYTDAMLHYARIATDTGVEMLCVGCEMLGAEPQDERWSKLLKSVRGEYSGLLTYNADQYYPTRPFLHKWYSELDLLGISFYTGSKRPNPTAEQIAEDIVKTAEDIGEMSKTLGIPVFFAECGARSVEGGALVPWDYKNSGKFDGDVQAAFLKAVVLTFSKCDWWKGLLWWKWDEQQKRPQYQSAGGDTGFTIKGKPAEETMRQWCSSKGRGI